MIILEKDENYKKHNLQKPSPRSLYQLISQEKDYTNSKLEGNKRRQLSRRSGKQAKSVLPLLERVYIEYN